MRVSGYLSGAPLDGQSSYILMHGYTGAVDKVPARLGRALLENLGSEINLEIEWPTSILSTLRQRGYLTDLSAKAELDLLKSLAAEIHKHDLETKPLTYSIIPTYTCNLRCPYCFQPHKLHSGKGVHSAVITSERIDQIFAIIDAQRVSRPRAWDESLPITLFGGEPLSKVTHSAIRKIADETRTRGGTLSAVTNGLELQHFTELLGCPITEVQVTLDGLAEMNDTRRTGPSFRSTFDQICTNIELALSHGVSVKVRINADRTNISHLLPLNEQFKQRGWYEHPNFYPYTAIVHSVEHTRRKTGESALSHAELIRHTLGLHEQFGSHIESYERLIHNFLEQALFEQSYPFQSVASCSAETGQLMFDAFGQVFSCWEDVGFSQHKVADYDETGLHYFGGVFDEWLRRSPDQIDGCSRCPYALIHKSGCGQHARASKGSIFSSECESFKEYFPEIFSRLYSDLERRILDHQV